MRPAMLLSFAFFAACAVCGASVPLAHEDVSLTVGTARLGTMWLGTGKIDPDRDCKFLAAEGRLIIELPGKYHDLWPDDGMMNAPRLLTEIEGDFNAQVRVSLSGAKLSEKSTAQKRQAYVAAGLLVIPHDGLALRYEFGLNRKFGSVPYHAECWCPKVRGISLFARDEGDRDWGLPKGLRTAYLRLERRGDRVTSMASVDGKNWIKIHGKGFVEFSGWNAKVKIGLFAASTSSEPFPPRFDEWKLTPVRSRPRQFD